jgi:hypothetical protein
MLRAKTRKQAATVVEPLADIVALTVETYAWRTISTSQLKKFKFGVMRNLRK